MATSRAPGPSSSTTRAPSYAPRSLQHRLEGFGCPRPDQARGDDTVGRDGVRLGLAPRAPRPRRLSFWIERDRVLHVHLVDVLADRRFGVFAHDADHLEVGVVTVVLVELHELGMLLLARDAPGVPEVDEHDLPAQRFGRDRLAVKVDE